VLCEVEAGLQQFVSVGGNRGRLAELRTILRTWPVDEPLVRRYGEFYVLARNRGRVLSFVDLLLAALSQELKAVLLTSDRDFEAFPELTTENWTT
jgi:predicted nucleic acid-binding protein